MTEAERTIFNRALVEYGISSQKMMAVEECAELTNAIAKLSRGRASTQDIITELADVSIIVDQLSMFFGEESFKEERARKVARLEERLRVCKHFDQREMNNGL